MEVIPAIDLRNGRCVRLYQGRFDQETVFSEDPVAVALGWLALGAPRLHVIDLDGADKGKPVNTATIEAIVKSVSISVQVGGGLRDIEAVEATLAMGVQRVILGTAAVENPALVKEACARFGEAVVLAVDARDGYVATHGWKEKTRFLAKDFVNLMAAQGIKRIIYTDIAHDGTLTGPNFNAIAQLMASTDLPIIASGGIASIDHLKRLARLRVEGAIIGQALYTGQIDLKEAITAVNSPTKPNRHRFNVQNMGILEHPERKRELDPERVLDLLPLEPNQKIADIGCGPGYFTIPLSRRLGRGRVYALD
ncbi:MAG: 1-(5-phosphoribosyl)-5-[(5-phosphoribosylamino)methylideneamino]imidazole-4-carboxamide isomerase, partial [Chloroflexi bacterium]|nr:1-(5-phosphoribosyl)-5-[(5-phosphoribosylamino)methylideneamino]imidazole-4-carboxamide isomerase [Chloroflexota bacterium]